MDISSTLNVAAVIETSIFAQSCGINYSVIETSIVSVYSRELFSVTEISNCEGFSVT